ncbi:MAG TPA: LCP family protein [Candidatus Scatomonas merdavium]|nr:LCP family protein [Candidatus Scatomonas merdavium]
MRGLPGWAKWTIGILIALGILLAAVFLWLHALLGKIQRVDREDTSFLPREEETFETDDDSGPAEDTVRPEDIDWSDVDVSVMQDDDVKNILLIGQDAREGEGRSRSDTMIICSLNRKTGKIILTSVMRDMYVPIPGYSDNRINAAYQLGGMALLDQVMEESLGISVDGNIEVNFQGFISAFSEIGSLDIELTEGEARYLNSNPAYLRQMGISTEGWNLKPGVNALTAEQALAYSRIRYVGNSDWERTDRQRKVLAAAFSKLRSSGIGTLLRLADRIFPHLTTDMDNAQLLGYVYSVVSSGMELDGSYRIPAEGTYTNETLRAGMEVLVPDLNANSRYLQEWIYG